jgi:hypothetical protein
MQEDVVSSRDLSGFRGFRWRRSLSNPSEILETSSLDYSTGIGRSSGGSLLRINLKLLHILKLVTSRPMLFVPDIINAIHSPLKPQKDVQLKGKFV